MTDAEWWCSAGTWSHDSPPLGFDYYVFKTCTLEPRVNPCELVLRSLPGCGYLNRIGVRNPSLDVFLLDIPSVPGHAVVSVLGMAMHEWASLALKCERAGVKVLELNLSCPNTECEPVGADAKATYRAVSAARHKFGGRLGAKLPPTVSEEVAGACRSAGADYLCLSNTLGTPIGGMSGLPLRSLALDCIHRISKAVPMHIVGGGGIMQKDDMWDYMSYGANDLFMGTRNILNGCVPEASNE